MIRRLFLPVLLLAAGFAHGAGIGADIERLRLAGDRPGARALLDSVLAAREADPESPPLPANLSHLAGVLAEDPVRAERWFRRVASDETADPLRVADAELRLGRLAFGRAAFGKALDRFRAARLAGLDEEGALWEGLAAYALGDVAAARSALERARASGNARLRQRAGMALGDLARLARDWPTAFDAYQQVRRDEAEGPGWWGSATYLAAGCAEEEGRTGEARDLLDELLGRRPDAYEAPLARARRGVLGAAEPPSPQDGEGSPEAFDRPPARFTIQAGAFSLPENAKALQETLTDLGFPGVRVEAEGGLHRVFVGRFFTRPEAEALGDSLVSVLPSGFSVIRLGAPE